MDPKTPASTTHAFPFVPQPPPLPTPAPIGAIPASHRLSTGNPLLDDLLGGGISRGHSCLLLGGPYSGKELVAAGFVHAAAITQEPVVVCLTGMLPSDFRALVARVGPALAAHESRGMVAYVDAYGTLLADRPTDAGIQAVLDPQEPSSLPTALLGARRALGEPAAFRLVVLGLTDLTLQKGHDRGHGWLARAVAVARASGATSMLSMDAGAHPDEELAQVLRLTQGALEFRESEEGRTFLRVRGLAGTLTREWIEYRPGETGIEILGSFSERRIR